MGTTTDTTNYDVCQTLPTVIMNNQHLRPITTFYSKEERLLYNAQYNQVKRRRRGDSGYSGNSRTSMSDSSYESVINLVLKSLNTVKLFQCNFFDYTEKLKHCQRPQYPHDGSRGYIKCDDGSAGSVTVDMSLPILQWTDERVIFALKVGLTDANGLPAKHFKVYIAKLGACSNLLETDENVFIFGDLQEGRNNISLERIGIRRKEEKFRAGKLEKECRLTSTLYLVDTKADQVFLCGQITSDQIKCEQEIGPPVLLDMEPKKSSSEVEGGVLAIKGKNFIPGVTKVFFRGKLEYECRLAENMASKNMLVCYIPHAQEVGGEVVEVFVRIEERQSASLKFQYISSQTDLFSDFILEEFMNQNGDQLITDPLPILNEVFDVKDDAMDE